jgi:ATP sulfurylase
LDHAQHKEKGTYNIGTFIIENTKEGNIWWKMHLEFFKKLVKNYYKSQNCKFFLSLMCFLVVGYFIIC